ncbi:MAG: ATPase, T2SS/T4P/T4SS family [Candidatus Omnitrophota bacterium]
MLTNQEIIFEGLKNLGILEERKIEEALSLQRTHRRRLSQALVELGYIANEDIMRSLAPQFGIWPIKIDMEKIPPHANELVNYDFAKLHRVVPLKLEQDTLTLATDNLFNFLAVGNLKKFLQANAIEMLFIHPADVETCLLNIYGQKKQTEQTPLEIQQQRLAFMQHAHNLTGKEDAPIIKLVSLLLQEAYQSRASDIHLEPLGESFRIRYRIDGVLQEIPGPPIRLTNALVSRIKLMAGMDIAEKRLPQDGRIKFTAGDKDLDLRASTLPAIYGESVVLRILDRSSLVLDLEKTGLSPLDKKNFENLLKLPNGIILVTGPTGCGKTTTLYTSLSQINKPNKKILTLEDPIEYQLAGINQVQVKPEIGLTFASGLRSMLRQAPDVIMVGEIRDYETAAISIQASLTGHLILSTLHTNDAPGALTRLVDMGVKPYLVASTLQGVLAQRLIRTLCPKCKETYLPNEEEVQAFGKTTGSVQEVKFYRPAGCQLCNGKGYKGRIGIFELLILDDDIRTLIAEHPVAFELRQTARKKGMRSLREDGWIKAAQGLTSLSEVLRVTQQ